MESLNGINIVWNHLLDEIFWIYIEPTGTSVLPEDLIGKLTKYFVVVIYFL